MKKGWICTSMCCEKDTVVDSQVRIRATKEVALQNERPSIVQGEEREYCLVHAS